MATSAANPDRTSDSLAKLKIQRAPTAARPSGVWRFLKGMLILVLLGGVALAAAAWSFKQGWISGGEKWVTVPEIIQPRPEVRLAAVTAESGRSADATVVATGYLESRRQAKVGARMPGRLELMHVEEGSRVKAGEVLAVLEHAEIDAALAAAEASLTRAKAALDEQKILVEQSRREFDRVNRLWKTKTVSDAEHDTARFRAEGAVARQASLAAEVELADARVRESKQMQANMFIRAPFDGTIISKDAEVGESILPGGMGEASGRGSAVTVADLDHLEVECDVKEDYISRVVPGRTAEVAVDAVPDYRYQGRVRKIIPMGDRARATIKVQVEIVNVDERLFPNMSATVYFLPDENAATTESSQKRVFCDSAAIGGEAGNQFVWILNDRDRTQQVPVETGAQRDGRTEITAGLTGSERVIIAPPGIQQGQLVNVLR
jgi:RND family efflux transporter MFP subunit